MIDWFFKHHLTFLIIQNEHKRLCHAGPKLTMGSLQDLYSIIGSRRAVHKYTRQWVTCQRASPKVTAQLMGQVPTARLLPSFANERVSVDYAEPLTLKTGTTRRPKFCKAYVDLQLNLATLNELVSDATAKAFIAALRRFLSRRENKMKSGATTQVASIVQRKIWRSLCSVTSNKPHKNLFRISAQHKAFNGNSAYQRALVTGLSGKMVSRPASVI